MYIYIFKYISNVYIFAYIYMLHRLFACFEPMLQTLRAYYCTVGLYFRQGRPTIVSRC